MKKTSIDQVEVYYKIGENVISYGRWGDIKVFDYIKSYQVVDLIVCHEWKTVICVLRSPAGEIWEHELKYERGIN